MGPQLDQGITVEITNLLSKNHLSSEIRAIIYSSLEANSKAGEHYRWAHLTLMNCECINGVPEVALPGAIAMELSALAADIFDDIQDQDNDDQPWRKIPTANALNLAICLSMLSSEAVEQIQDGRIYREVNRTLNKMWIRASDGQFQEALLDTCEKVSLDDYFDLVKRKSGSLTASACKIGAILGGASEEIVLQLEQFGSNLGIMSQLWNDLNDFLNFEKKRDFVNNRKTLPYVYLLNTLDGKKVNEFRELTRLQRFGKQEQDYLKQLAIDEGVVHYCRVMYELFRRKSLEIVQRLPVLENRKEKMIKLVEENV
ncbi:polyprenyl synthetase family protein [Desulfosporosinus sp. SYSU MS00001]|uniref:polyprenyl synthetase family protein n=1 Tax=Desulfosporosinus sp. SYSU MS00001 TaxID=3416284 RepID=UPI003CF059EC